MDTRRLQASLVALQLVSVATLVRSVMYDRWITVLASVLLLLGAAAAQRGRSWGVALSLASAAAFPVAWMIGIAPSWFCLVGVVGALPYAIASSAFARFDRGATALLTFAALTAGTLGAIGWKAVAWPLFMTFPSWRPSLEANHVGLTAAILATAAIATHLGRRGEDGSRVRIGEQVRVASETHASDEELASDEGEAEPRRRMRQ